MELLSEAGMIDTSLLQAFEDISSGLSLFEEGDVLFAKITPCMENGKGAFVESLPTRYAFGSTEFHVLRPSHAVNAKFLYYYTFNPIFRAYAAENMSGAAGQKRVSSRFLRDTRLFLPPLPEQERIAAYLDASCAAIDAAVAAKRGQLEGLDGLWNTTLHVAFAHEDWPVERIKDVAVKIGSGVTPEGGASSYLDEGIPLLRSQNVHFDGLRLADVAFISEETHAEMAGSRLKPRDVLLNITGASIGRCTFIPDDFGEGNVNQHVCIIRGSRKIDHRFLAGFLSSPMGQGQILSSFTGASRQGLSHKDLGLINIPFPPLGVQRDIVSALEREKSNQDRMRANIESQISTLLAYRKSLIHECVTGARRVAAADVARAAALRPGN
jgi:type I restriction enzyme S subunit